MMGGSPGICPICQKDVQISITQIKQEMQESCLVIHMEGRMSCGHTVETLSKYPTEIILEGKQKICPIDGKQCFFIHECEFCHVHLRREKV